MPLASSERTEHAKRTETGRQGEAGTDAGSRAAGSTGEAGSTSGTPESRAGTTTTAAAAPSRRRLDQRPWWERIRGRLDYELAALDNAGITYRKDEVAFQMGRLRLELEMTVKGEPVRLVATFPDLYPHFRFQVSAPDLKLDHHQHPFGGNLCLIGRPTQYWRSDDTLAGLLLEQLPKVLDTGKNASKESASGIEQQQAEPYSDYYPKVASMIVVPGHDPFPAEKAGGRFIVATTGPIGPPPDYLLRGAVTEIRRGDHEVVFQAAPRVLVPYDGPRLMGRWAFLPRAIETANSRVFLEELFTRVPHMLHAEPNPVPGGWLQVWGVLFPEEHEWREDGKQGIIFFTHFSKQRKSMLELVRNLAYHGRSKGGKKRK